MTIEQLMQPRWKVLADYPQSVYTVGEILFYKDVTSSIGAFFREYPHLFKKLEWWEERKVEDMPMYLKHEWVVDSLNKPVASIVVKVQSHFKCYNKVQECYSPSNFTTTLGFRERSYFDYLPSTEQEYLNYQSNKP